MEENGLMGLELLDLLCPVLDTGPPELGVSLIIALLDSVGVILDVGV